MAGGPTVGLDIGSNLMKAVEVRRGSNGLQVVALGIEPTPPGAMENNVVVDPQLLGKAVKDLLRKAGISAKQVVSSVSGQSVVVRVIDVPKMNETELADTMKWEVERQVPFNANEIIFDYRPITRQDVTDDQNMEVVLAVAQQELIDRHVEMLFAAGLKPLGIDVEPLAASRCLLDAGAQSRPGFTVAIINVGASNTDVGIFRDKLLAFPRTLPIAGDNLTRAISESLQVDLTTAENYKREYGEVILDQIAQPAAGFGGGTGFVDPGMGFINFSDQGVPTNPATPSQGLGRMPFDFSSEAPAPLAGEPAPFDASGDPAPAPFEPTQPSSDNPFGSPTGDAGFAPIPDAFPAPPATPAPMNLPMAVPVAADAGGDVLRTQVFNAIAPVLLDLTQEVRRSLDYYRGKVGDGQIDEILLIGGSAKLRNLAPYFEAELGIPTRVADPLQSVQVTSKNFSQSHLEEMATLFPVSIGLGAYNQLAVAGAPKGGKKR